MRLERHAKFSDLFVCPEADILYNVYTLKNKHKDIFIYCNLIITTVL